MRSDTPRVLLVNPWIHDFAAYDVWARPLGLLRLGAILRAHGYSVALIDCLDRFHPSLPPTDPTARFGRGPYPKTPIPRPTGLDDVPRTYSRYGIDPIVIRRDLSAQPRPDLILVTSMMTYWYPGVAETVAHLRDAFPGTPVILGGIYARLLSDHAAARIGADRVVTSAAEGEIVELAGRLTGAGGRSRLDPEDPDAWPYPALDLCRRIPFVPLQTLRGCPFRCAYCASGLLDPVGRRRSPEAVAAEIAYWHDAHGVIDFVFYDDALLVAPERHAIPLFEAVIRSGRRVRFHTPNAVHIREMDDRMAALMRRAGVETLRLGLETTDADRRGLDQKATFPGFRRAAAALRRAGFSGKSVGAYLLWGLPGQTENDLVPAIDAVKAEGITPILAQYTPIPGTALWRTACEASRYPLETDPVFTNNAVFPCQPSFSWETLSRLKARIAG